MEWRTSDKPGWPPSMGNTLQLTGEGSATSLHSSAPALLHPLRTRRSMDAAHYLNQARATYPGGVSEQDTALHLLHLPDEALEVGGITIFVEGAGETPIRLRPTNAVYDGTKPTPPVRCHVRGVPQRAHLLSGPPTGDSSAPWLRPPAPDRPLIRDERGPSKRAPPLGRAPRYPLLLLIVTTRGDQERVLGATPVRLYGVAPLPRPPSPAAPAARLGARLPANTGGHRHYGARPCATPPGII